MTVEADEYAIDECAGSSADRGQGLAFVETVDPSPVPDHVPAPGVSKRAIGFGAWLDRHDRGAPSRKRSDSGRWLDAHVWTIVAVAGALPALRLRAAWLVVCAGVAIGVRAVELARGQSRAKGSADLVVVPARVAVRMVLGALNPLLWLRLIFGLLVALTAGVLAAGIIAAAKWLITQGTDGILAATRMGVWAHTPTYAAFGACVLVVRGSGETHEQRAAMARRATCRLPEVAVAGLAVVVCVTGIAFTIGGPTLDLGLSRADGLAWVPAGLRRDVDGLRDQLVTAELDALAHCLNGHQPARWTSSYTAANPIDQPDVARLVADPARAPDAATLASAALAAQNVLAPWVERIEIAVGTHVVFTVLRERLHSDEPITNPRVLLARSPGAPPWLTTIVANTDTVLACSAPPCDGEPDRGPETEIGRGSTGTAGTVTAHATVGPASCDSSFSIS